MRRTRTQTDRVKWGKCVSLQIVNRVGVQKKISSFSYLLSKSHSIQDWESFEGDSLSPEKSVPEGKEI